MIRRLVAALIALACVSVGAAAQTSTINPLLPSPNSGLNSSILRGQFGAAANDINRLYSAIGTPIQIYGPVANSGLDISAALTTAVTSSHLLIFDGGTFRLSQNVTVPAGTVLYVRPGSCLSIDSGITLTVHGSFAKEVYTQIFCGVGTVTGMRFVRPDWYGCTGTADNVCVNKAIAAVENSFGSDGDKQTVAFGCKAYSTTGPIVFSPTNIINHYPDVCGEQNGGTVISAAAGFSGVAPIVVAGQTRGLPGVIADFNIGGPGGFQIVNNSGNAALSCLAVAPTAGTDLEGDRLNTIVATCHGFKAGITGGSFRLIKFDRFAFFSDVVGALCYSLIPNDALSFIGDSKFPEQNCDPHHNLPDVTALDTQNSSYGSLITPNGGGIAGLSWGGEYYHSNNGFINHAINGGSVSDQFYGTEGKMQIDGWQCNVFDINANGVGTTTGQITSFSNIQVNVNYIRGVVPGCAMLTASVTVAGSGTTTGDSVRLDSKFVANIGGYGAIFTGVTNFHVRAGAWLADGHSGTSGIVIGNGSTVGTVDGNTCQGLGNPTFTYDRFIFVDASTDYISVQPTNTTNGLCGTPLVNNSTGTHNSIGTIH